ncbi:hypothetical protein SteCoe_3756 [Stentor coeruleus]|uniref:Uncharacterized protein n=1 Tax=Stentor coeruleus TaxID=5963 RepID=A0A1R2CWD9_9CILI|nr:hypothetical protein SteCoe_3756 [Stentor coeruleus]
MSEDPSTQPSELLKPRFGFFSYIPGVHRIVTPKKTKQNFPTIHITKSSINKPFLDTSQSYISIGDKFHESKFELRPNKYSSEKMLSVHNKIFKPPGPYCDPYLPYPFIPTKQYKSKTVQSDEHYKNIKVPKTEKLFSIFPYINPENQPKTIPRPKFFQKKKFVSVVKRNNCFNNSAVVYGSTNILQESSDECEDKVVDEVVDEVEVLKDLEKNFKPMGRSTSEIFAQYQYKSEIDFPAKKRLPAVTKIHKKMFKRTNVDASKASPSIVKMQVNLMKEYKLS